MPTYKTGDMWSAYEAVDLFLVTTNSYVDGYGCLVMGAGIAKQAKDRWPGLAAALGVSVTAGVGHLGIYGLLISKDWPKKKLGAFQTKTHPSKPSDLTLIKYSTDKLYRWLEAHPTATVALNWPGVGLGGLTTTVTKPIIDKLPAKVQIWSYGI